MDTLIRLFLSVISLLLLEADMDVIEMLFEVENSSDPYDHMWKKKFILIIDLHIISDWVRDEGPIEHPK